MSYIIFVLLSIFGVITSGLMVTVAIFAKRNNDERGTMIINQSYAYGFSTCIVLLVIIEVLAHIYSLSAQTILNLIILTISLSALLVSTLVFVIHQKTS
ncbi:hypothetical protein QZN09_12280 [Staphylococcus haemolyticus]|uniref:hypothetical protein n=1 Tax=Staphylococcus haemolyticus TaxID=1283 RepID=UPI002652973C|nr:hypothetical protein [Staphylococcus haemolyticus]MDN7231781.1 hypothetical protein [Staphylococcus haemolyticus]